MSNDMDSHDLRQAMVRGLRDRGAIETDAVEEAFLSVAREAFVPQAWPAAVYRDIAIPTKFDRHGRATSSSSQPGIMGPMLEMLRAAPGHRVLEVGAGTGYNAALVREIVGAGGHVIAVDYQPGVSAEAAAHLKHAGYHDIEVLTRDGALGMPGSQFDRIMVTAACRDVPLTWWEQLKPGGVLVLPLRRGSMQAVFSLVRTDEGFESERAVMGGFMSMQGGFGPPAGLRYIGPRRDIGLIANSPLSRHRSDLLVSLLCAASREEQPAVLRQVFPPVEKPPPGEFWNFHVFLAAIEPNLFDIITRSPIYGFASGPAVLDDGHHGLAVLPSSDMRPGQGRGEDFHPRLLVFGSASAMDHLLQHAADFVSRGRPGVERLRLTLTRRKTAGRRSHWHYAYSYDPAN